MKITISLLLMACGLVKVCPASAHSDRWSVREEETVQKTMTLAGEPGRIVIDNVEGFVHVSGTDGNEVRVSAHEIIRAETDADAQEAKKEVSLQFTEKPGTVSVYYDAPWRCHDGQGGCRGEQKHFYNVTYDIDVQVPRTARLVVSAVSGDIRVGSTTGDFEINDVNGGIKMSDVAGAGDVHTVNGPVTVSFSSNPRGPCSFKSINGQLEVYFQPGLSADLLFQTMNGGIYTDFDVTARATAAAQGEQRDGKFIYRSKGPHGARVGQGGPELSFNTLNGSIRLHDTQGALKNE
jgi:hypothetical protein